MLELYRLTLFAGLIVQKKKPQEVNVGSKHDETEIYNCKTVNIASMHNTSLFAKLSILFNRTVYK